MLKLENWGTPGQLGWAGLGWVLGGVIKQILCADMQAMFYDVWQCVSIMTRIDIYSIDDNNLFKCLLQTLSSLVWFLKRENLIHNRHHLPLQHCKTWSNIACMSVIKQLLCNYPATTPPTQIINIYTANGSWTGAGKGWLLTHSSSRGRYSRAVRCQVLCWIRKLYEVSFVRHVSSTGAPCHL